MMYKRKPVIFILLCLLLNTLAFAKPKFFRFNSNNIAQAETQMWKAYYERDYQTLLFAMVTTLIEQFDLNLFEAGVVAAPGAKAAKIFHSMSHNSTNYDYHQKVLPDLITFFKALKDSVGGEWDPAQVAEVELSWWVARRTPGLDSPEYVGQRIAKVYAMLYGSTNNLIKNAGYLRAIAADSRDKQSQRDNVKWHEIQMTLEQSYDYLLQGVTK